MQPFVTSIQKILRQKLNISTFITPQTDLKKDLNLVDWEMLYLMNAIEQRWHVSLAQNEIESVANIEQLLAVVKKNSARSN